MDAARAETVSRRHEVYQALVKKEAVQQDIAAKNALAEGLHLPVKKAHAALPETVGKSLNVQA